jgi:adenylosuccinate synthase
MNKQIIVILSGEIAAGKSTLAEHLSKEFAFCHFRTKDVLLNLSKQYSRVDLQNYGEQLDRETEGGWVVQSFTKQYLISSAKCNRFVIDAVRIKEQVAHFRKRFPPIVVHVHVKCSDAKVLEERFNKRLASSYVKMTHKKYAAIKRNATESQVNSLEAIADLVINTGRCTENDVLIRVCAYLRILPKIHEPNVDVIIGGQFGSEGKGQISGYLSREYDCLIRVGGPNAGHSVYSEPNPHKFHILPSGSTNALQTKLIIAPGAVLNVDGLLDEMQKYQIEPSRLLIDENVTIIRDCDIKLESKLQKGIGSTRQGVGSATANNILQRLPNKKLHKAKYNIRLKPFIGCARDAIDKVFQREGKILLEGTQGTLLSLHHGIYPFVTSRDTTVNGCLAEAGIAPRHVRRIIMVTRCYPIRVQSPAESTSGPFCRNGHDPELNWKDIATRSNIPLLEILKAEKTTTTNRNRRVAEFSWELFREACSLNSPTDIALTFVDYLTIKNREARRFEQLDSETIYLIEEIERCAEAPVSLISTRFGYRSIIDRRTWKDC